MGPGGVLPDPTGFPISLSLKEVGGGRGTGCRATEAKREGKKVMVVTTGREQAAGTAREDGQGRW